MIAAERTKAGDFACVTREISRFFFRVFLKKQGSCCIGFPDFFNAKKHNVYKAFLSITS